MSEFAIPAQEQQKATAAGLLEQTPTPRQAPQPTGGFFQQAVALGKTPDASMSPQAVTNLLASAEDARKADGAKERYLQSKRGEFERRVSIKLSNNDEVKAAVQKLSDKAFSYMMKTRGEAALSMLGADPTKGDKPYGGMVGKDPAVVKDVLSRGEKGGNIREQMLALQNFQNVIGNDLTDSKAGLGADKMKDAAGKSADGAVSIDHGAKRADFTPEDMKRLEERQAAIKKENGGKDASTKQMFSATKAEAGDKHKEFAAAKKQNMDTKLPSVPSAAAQQAIPGLAPQLTPAQQAPGAMLPDAEMSPLARSRRTVEGVEAEGLHLSDREKGMAGAMNTDGGAAEVPWIEGQKANIVDKEADFVKEANSEAMPLKAGISGTTFRMMELAELMGLEGKEAELIKSACMSSLISVEAHSMHEVTVASSGFVEGEGGKEGGKEGGEPKGEDKKMEPGKLAGDTYTPDNIKPLKEEDLAKCAAEVGCSLQFIRTGQPGGAAGDIAPPETAAAPAAAPTAGPGTAPPTPPPATA